MCPDLLDHYKWLHWEPPNIPAQSAHKVLNTPYFSMTELINCKHLVVVSMEIYHDIEIFITYLSQINTFLYILTQHTTCICSTLLEREKMHKVKFNFKSGRDERVGYKLTSIVYCDCIHISSVPHKTRGELWLSLPHFLLAFKLHFWQAKNVFFVQNVVTYAPVQRDFSPETYF